MNDPYRKPRGLFDELILSERQLYKRHELGSTLFTVGLLSLFSGISVDVFFKSHGMDVLSPYLSLVPAGTASFALCAESIVFTYLYPSVSRKGMLRLVACMQIGCFIILAGTVVLLLVCSELMIDLSKFISMRILASVWVSAAALYFSHLRVIWRVVNVIRQRVKSSY